MNRTDVVYRRRARRAICDLVRKIAARTGDAKVRKQFFSLVSVVREKSDLLQPRPDSRLTQESVAATILEALYNLACFHKSWQRDCAGWNAPNGSVRNVFASLVQFLIVGHPVPDFLLNCWLMEQDDEVRRHLKWYVHMARSGTIRGTSTPFTFDRDQARCFADAPCHLSVEDALEWSRSYRTPENGQRTRPRLTSRRRWKLANAQQQQWHRGDWKGIPVPNFELKSEPSSQQQRTWSIRQLLRRVELVREGRAMQHCVADYHPLCASGETSIWSMRVHEAFSEHRMITIEVDSGRREIITALGCRNRRPSDAARRVMKAWSQTSHLAIASWV